MTEPYFRPALALERHLSQCSHHEMTTTAGFLLLSPAVAFVSPHCGFCHALKPAWDELSERLVGNVRAATVDATTEAELAALKYKVESHFSPGLAA